MAEANTPYSGTQDEVAKIIYCLIENGSTPSGPMLDFWELQKRTGIEALELYRVIKSVFDVGESKRLLEAEPANQINSRSAEERIKQREKANPPYQVSLRLSEVGIRLAKEEIGVQYQYKQLGDFDAAVERSRRSSLISKVGLVISASSMIIAGISLIRTCRADQSQPARTTTAVESSWVSVPTDSATNTPAKAIPKDVQVTQ